MTTLNAELIRRWFEITTAPYRPLIPLSGIVLNQEERSVLEHAQLWMVAAVERGEMPIHPPTVTQPEAQSLRDYLQAIASGIAGSRMALAQTGQLSVDESGDSMCLVAGLIAGAAALGDPGTLGLRESINGAEPTFVEAARNAGLAAADSAVDGAELHLVAELGAAAAMNGWAVGFHPDPDSQVEYRTRGLICLVLLGFQLASLPPDPPVTPAGCGAGPRENLGDEFDAEVTFDMQLSPEDPLPNLRYALRELCSEVRMWTVQGVTCVHLHTRRPGEAIAEAYAVGMLFDLKVTSIPRPI